MSRPLGRFLALGVPVLCIHCMSSGTETDNPLEPDGVEFRRSSLPYQVVQVPADDRAVLAESSRAFALDLYGAAAETADRQQNLWLASYSVQTVLGMTYAGARGTTAAELEAVLHWEGASEDYHRTWNALNQQLQAGTAGSAVRFDTLTSVWLAREHSIADSFLDVLSGQYDTGTYLVDFAGDAAGARESINSWVSDQTEGLIPELFGPGAFQPSTQLVLASAAYLMAPWEDPFDPENTYSGEFVLPDGDVVEASLMRRTEHYPFVFDVDWRAVEMPFLEANMGMVFVLPNPGEFDDFEASLDATRLETIVTALDTVRADEHRESLRLTVPRFDFGTDLDLRSTLESLGMTSAFDQLAADFSGMDLEHALYVDKLVHQTTVEVDEYGTTSGAVSAVVMPPSSISPALSLDRPFFFFVYDHETQMVLFLGRLVRPAGEARAPAEPPVIKSDAETICDVLDGCEQRTTQRTECLDALAADDPATLDQCADCHLMANDLCAGMPGCTWGPDVCAGDVCAEYCPGHPF